MRRARRVGLTDEQQTLHFFDCRGINLDGQTPAHVGSVEALDYSTAVVGKKRAGSQRNNIKGDE
jgi:hypothetical protein